MVFFVNKKHPTRAAGCPNQAYSTPLADCTTAVKKETSYFYVLNSSLP